MFNVAYRAKGRTRLYLMQSVATREEAEKWRNEFNRRFVGKPYPNGKGVYTFSHAWVVSR